MTRIPTSSEEKLLQEHGYKLIRKIGEGGYAKVFIGEFRSKNTDKVYPLACKIINTTTAPDKYVNKFLPREMKILVKINHPHIIHVHSIFQRNKMFFIFMRYAEKGDLLDFLLANGALKERQARVWVRQLALALQYLHTLEIAHRDIKCENILVTSNYNVKLADFGFSRYVINFKSKQQLSETYCGTLICAPPEIIGGQPYGPKIADMWSFGIVVFTMLNKANPFNERNRKVLLTLQTTRSWKFRSKFEKQLSPEVKSLVRGLLEPDVKKRFTIDQVLNSDWMGMDPRLKVMNAHEFTAFGSALEEAKAKGGQSNVSECRTVSRLHGKSAGSFNFLKQYDNQYVKHLDRSRKIQSF